MTIAAIEGPILFAIIAGVIALVKWLASKNEADAAPPTPGSSEAPRPTRGGETEEERMRRFLEALGIPGGEAPPAPPRREIPPPIPRQPRPFAMPSPPIIAAPPRRAQRPRPLTAATPPLPRKPQSLDEADAPTAPVCEITLPELKTTPVAEFVTTSSTVSAAHGEFVTTSSSISAVPMDGPHAHASDAYDELVTKAPVDTLRALLRSRDSVRTAVLLREVLGPPPGLQRTLPGLASR